VTDTPKAGPLDWRQRHTNQIETMETHLDGRQAQIHTATPGVIVSYDAAAMTVVVQPAIQGMHQKLDGKIEPVTITPIRDVPVHFPSGGGHTMTFPIAEGDECLIMFSERNIDNWFQHGGVGQPRDYRMHDINDAFVLVGLKSQPKALAGVNTSAVQIRSNDGLTSITLGGGSGVTIKTGLSVTLEAPKVTIKGDLDVTGEVKAKSGGGFVTLSQHIQAGQKPIPNT
jgi:hypothetical protein